MIDVRTRHSASEVTTPMLLPLGSFIFCAIIVAIFIHNLYTKRYDFVTFRNIFFLGFVYFYALTLFLFSRGATAEDLRGKVGRAGASYEVLDDVLFWLYVTFILFFLAATWSFKQQWLARAIPRVKAPTGSPMILGVGIAASTLSFLLVLAPPTGYLGLLSVQFKVGFASLGAALGMYYLLSQRFNPAAWIVFISLLSVGILATTAGAADRRGPLAVIMAVGVVWYYAELRFRSATFNLARLSLVAAFAFVLIIGYSSFRHSVNDKTGIAAVQQRIEQFGRIFDINRMREIFDTVLYQDTTFNSGFIIENYPDGYPYRGARDAVFVATLPVPRAIWPEKPIGLGEEIQKQLDSTANLGPGIIGHGWAAAGPFGIIAFALFYGVAIGVADRVLKQEFERRNPWMIMIGASNLGNVMALPRGDTALFTVQILACVISSAGLVIIATPVLGPVARAMKPLEPAAWRRHRAAPQTNDALHAPADAPARDDQPIDNNWAALAT